jgi:hypothetical protein
MITPHLETLVLESISTLKTTRTLLEELTLLVRDTRQVLQPLKQQQITVNATIGIGAPKP